MSRGRRLPEIPKAALRDYHASDQAEAVWRRLKPELRAFQRSERRTPWAWVWAPALSAVLFGSGVFVGARFIRPQALPFVRAEPRAQALPASSPVVSKNAAEPEVVTPPLAHVHLRRALTAAPAEPMSYAADELSGFAAA